MRASGRPPYSHRDPSRPGRGVDRPGLSLGALAHRLMSLRQSLTRRLGGAARHPGYALPRQGQGAAQSWAASPNAMLGRDREPEVPMPRVLPPEMAPFGAAEPRFGAAEPRFGARAAAGFGPPEAARPEPGPQGWPDHVFDDRAGFEPPPARHESRIDHAASTPGVLVRQPRRPAAIAPEGVPADAYASAPAAAPAAPQPSAVRFTRTPDAVLQERRQRALEAERAALERARAEAQAALQAQADAQQAAERAEAERRAADEEIARQEAARQEAARQEAERAAAEAVSARIEAGPPVPLWRQPFVASEGVRYFRTPDRRPARPSVELSPETPAPQETYGPVAATSAPEVEVAHEAALEAAPGAVCAEAVPAALAAPEHAAEHPVAAPACGDFSDLPDWSGMQPWFGADDGVSASEAWAALDAAPSVAAETASDAVGEPEAGAAAPYVAVPVDISHLRSLPPKPVYVLDRLVRFDMPPRPADLQDNASARAAEERAAAAAAAVAAFLPPRPALTLVFGPETPAPAGPGDAAVPAAPVAETAPRALRPALSAMAARAAIRPARPPGAPEPVPAPCAPAAAPASLPRTRPPRSSPRSGRPSRPRAPRPSRCRSRRARSCCAAGPPRPPSRRRPSPR